MPLDLPDALRRHLLQRFPADRDYPRAVLQAEGMPPLVAAFLERALDRWLEIEREQLRSDWFDFDAQSVQQAEAQFFSVLARTARVPAEAWKATLGGSVDLVVRFLTTPARALTDALFEGDSEPLPTAEIRRRLSLFAAYLYFPEVAAAYLDKKQPETLDPQTLFHLLDRIDRRIVSDYRPDDWLALLDPLFGLARTVPTFDGVPASLLQRFFRAKGYEGIAEALEPHVGTAIDEIILRRLLEPDADAPAPLPPPPSAPAQEKEDSTTAPERPYAEAAPEAELSDGTDDSDEIEAESEDHVEPVPHNDLPSGMPEHAPDADAFDSEESEASEPLPTAPETVDLPDEPVPLWQRYAHGTEASPAAAETEVEEAEDTAPLWKRFAPGSGAAAATAPGPVAAPESLATVEGRVLGQTSPERRARFVKHMFKGDERAYAAVLRSLDEAPTWTEASRVIARDVFRPYKVNIYGDHAIDFTDAVESRYRS